MQSLTDDWIDPTFLQVLEKLSESASVSGNSDHGSSILDDDVFSEDEEETPKDTTVIRKNSSGIPQKRKLDADDVNFEPDNRKRDSYYRNMGNCLRENLKILGNYTECYGILLLTRDFSPR